jgi:hypothetical protein
VKKSTYIIVFILLSIVLACDIGPVSIDLGLGEDSSKSVGGQMEVAIDSPINGSSLQLAPVDIAYHATSTDGLSAVELSVNGEVISTFANPDTSQKVITLSYSWQPIAGGSHTIRVRALNALGIWSDYSSSTINIESNPQSAEQENSSSPPVVEIATDTPSPTATPDEMTIYNIKHDRDKFYYGGGSCGSREVTISADITHPDDAYAAILFIRFYDNEGGGLTKWDSGRAMGRKTDDHFSATLASNKIPNYNAFEFAVMYYQIVIQDKAGNRIARSEVIKKLLLERCP